MRYQNEIGRIEDIRQYTTKLDELKGKAREAERKRDLEKAADITYYAIPDLERKIAELKRQEKE